MFEVCKKTNNRSDFFFVCETICRKVFDQKTADVTGKVVFFRYILLGKQQILFMFMTVGTTSAFDDDLKMIKNYGQKMNTRGRGKRIRIVKYVVIDIFNGKSQLLKSIHVTSLRAHKSFNKRMSAGNFNLIEN